MDLREQRAIERVRLELVTRKLMVMVLALIGVWVGIGMCLTGAPDFMETWFSPWSRYAIGGGAFLTGLVTSIGGFVGDRTRKGWWTQVVGLWGLVLWYWGMGAAYLALFMIEGADFVAPGDPLPVESTGRGYVIIVYWGMAVLAAIPLVTMLRLNRPGAYGPLDAMFEHEADLRDEQILEDRP